MKRLLAVALVLGPSALLAQASTPVTKDANISAAVQVQRDLWSGTIRHITTAAGEWPEADYDWRPTAGVRTFGELVAHVAGAQYAVCAPALGESRDADEANVERDTRTKTAIVAALEASTAYCDRAYRISEEQSARPVSVFGMQRTALFAIALNTSHNAEHYGNIVTYMRMKGMVPPSSRRQ